MSSVSNVSEVYEPEDREEVFDVHPVFPPSTTWLWQLRQPHKAMIVHGGGGLTTVPCGGYHVVLRGSNDHQNRYTPTPTTLHFTAEHVWRKVFHNLAPFVRQVFSRWLAGTPTLEGDGTPEKREIDFRLWSSLQSAMVVHPRGFRSLHVPTTAVGPTAQTGPRTAGATMPTSTIFLTVRVHITLTGDDDASPSPSSSTLWMYVPLIQVRRQVESSLPAQHPPASSSSLKAQNPRGAGTKEPTEEKDSLFYVLDMHWLTTVPHLHLRDITSGVVYVARRTPCRCWRFPDGELLSVLCGTKRVRQEGSNNNNNTSPSQESNSNKEVEGGTGSTRLHSQQHRFVFFSPEEARRLGREEPLSIAAATKRASAKTKSENPIVLELVSPNVVEHF